MPERLYVSCADARTIEILDLDESGTLRRHATVPVPGPAGVAMSMPLALSADRTRLYAAVRAAPHPLASFAVAEDGGLTLLGTTDLPAGMAYISVLGRYLLSASYPGSLIASHPIGADGAAHGPAIQITATPDRAHCILPDPAGRFVYVPCLGGDAILHLEFNPATGALVPAGQGRSGQGRSGQGRSGQGRVEVRAGAGPRHMRFAAGGRVAYVLNELDASLDIYAVDPATGALSLRQTVQTLPPGTQGRIAAADVHLTPNGCFLYASERLTNSLSAWRIAPDTGLLSPLGSVPSEPGPRGFAISPDGRFLLCAGQTSHRVGVYAIDAETGELKTVGGLQVAANPNWVTFLRG
jgi:6-phosphogluconolactonase